LGCLTVDRTKEHSLLQEDLDLMVTLAAQVAIALDNAEAYHQIEELNVGLGVKVQERTAELERLNRDLAVANDKLRELDRAKSGFVSMVSHELRTPMTSIKGYVENLLDGLVGGLTERQVYYLTRVKHNIERLTRMIYDLLDLSRIEAGAVVVKFAPLSVPDLITDVVESFQGMTAEKGITLIAEPDAALPVIQGDRDKLHQVLINLIQNAVKFTPRDGRIVVEGRLCEPEAVQLCVADTGCGIPADELPRIFDRFYSGDSIPGEARGAGLGLAITKSLVELHGGRIWVESVPCEGSRFYFTLPIRQVAPVEGLQSNPA
jgi:signal transduction histidine kinase